MPIPFLSLFLRPFRLMALLALAFAAGIVFEQNSAATACAEAGGHMARGVCLEGGNE